MKGLLDARDPQLDRTRRDEELQCGGDRNGY
jgi:hypothetical protein